MILQNRIDGYLPLGGGSQKRPWGGLWVIGGLGGDAVELRKNACDRFPQGPLEDATDPADRFILQAPQFVA